MPSHPRVLLVVSWIIALTHPAVADKREGDSCKRDSECPSNGGDTFGKCANRVCKVYFHAELMACDVEGDVQKCSQTIDDLIVTVLLPTKRGERTDALPCASTDQCRALAAKLNFMRPEAYVCKKPPAGYKKQDWGTGGPWCFLDATIQPPPVAVTDETEDAFNAFVKTAWKLAGGKRGAELGQYRGMSPQLVELDVVAADLDKLQGESAKTATSGKYTLSPTNRKLTPKDFEQLVKAGKIKLLKEADVGQDDRIWVVAGNVFKKYSAKYVIPGVEFWKWLYENPSKAPDVLKPKRRIDQIVLFGSVVSDPDGEWKFPNVRWNGKGFDLNLAYRFTPDSLVVVIEK